MRLEFQTEAVPTHVPSIAQHQADRVAYNPSSIRRIEIHDLTSCLETVWDASWEKPC